MNLVDSALVFATRAHAGIGQRRKYTGEPYIVHPIEVMMLVRSVGGSDEMQAAALLHDVVEDTPVTSATVYAEFDLLVGGLVDQLTEPDWPGNRKERKVRECARLAGISPDAQTIKYADLISNTSTIAEHDPGFARVYFAEKAALLKVMDKGNPVLRQMALNRLPPELLL
jgi:guanosine-3',5'-bis(diphosphate) 3'-pyrophosphohydrolase